MLVLRKLFYLTAFGLFLVFAFSVHAVEFRNTDNTVFEGKTVDSIVIENRNIYDTNQKEYDNFIFNAANKFHITTQKRIIAREVLLKKGEPYSVDLAEETARILRRRLILFDAWLENEIYDENKLLIRVVTIDRWSLAIGAELKREGNVHTLKIGALEKNLFGQNRLISFHYINQSDDDSYTDASFVETRLFGEKLKSEVKYSTNPKDNFKSFSFEKPFYDLNQRFGFGLQVRLQEGRIDYYSNDSITAQTFFKGDKTESQLFYRFGSYSTKFLTLIQYTYNYEKNSPEVIDSTIAQDSLYHALTTVFEYAHYDYKKKINIDGFNYTEDFNNGIRARIELQKAYNYKENNNVYDFYGVRLLKNFITENSLFSWQYLYRRWYNGSVNLRNKSILNIKYYNQSVKSITFAGNFEYQEDASVQSFDLVKLGGTTGVRGADKYFLTGDKRIVLNSEIRFLPNISFLSLNIGGLIFSDFGNIVQETESLSLSNTYLSYGAGLRLAFDKSSKNVLRIDFAYSRFNGWQISFGSGQYFNASDRI